MNSQDLKNILSNPFGTTAFKELDNSQKQYISSKETLSILDVSLQNLDSESNFEVAFLTDRTLNIYSKNFNISDKKTLENFEIALKKDSQTKTNKGS